MNASEIRWREPMFGPDSEQHTFKVGDRVRIARIADAITTREIIGHQGVIFETDSISPTSVEMQCHTCGGVHTMHEQELDYFGDDLVQFIQEKAGIPLDPVIVDEVKEALENSLALAAHRAGFHHVCVKDRPVPLGDPRCPRPAWSKHVYGVITRLAPLRGYHEALIQIADQAGGYLAEWAVYSHKFGYNAVITEADLDTLTLEMPIRALIVAKESA